MNPAMTTRRRALDAPLAAADEELLAELIDDLSERRGETALGRLEALAAEHPHLAGQLRELFAAVMVTDAVDEH